VGQETDLNNHGKNQMNKETRFILMLAALSGEAFASSEQAPVSLGYAQQLFGKSVEEVKAADLNGDKHIDATEFGALTQPGKDRETSRAE
jgi:hypothetical protein